MANIKLRDGNNHTINLSATGTGTTGDPFVLATSGGAGGAGDASAANQTTIITDIGTVTETAPATDTASSGLNGRLQRIAQRLTSTIALLPASLGQKAKTASLAVTLASDDDSIAQRGIVTETAPATDTASSGLNGRLQRIAQRLTSLIALVPASLGQKAKTGSFAVTLASDEDLLALQGALTETAPATDTASSGINGRLQRIAQRITSLIALVPASLGQKAKTASFAVTLASDDDSLVLHGALTETAPATDTASSGLNGRLQRIAQRLTSLIALVPASLGQKAKTASFAVTLASDEDLLATNGALADAAVTAGATGSISAKLRSISRDLVANIVLAAGSNTIGNTKDAGPSWTTAFGVTSAYVTSADMSAAVASVSDAPTSGQKICVDDVLVSVDTAMRVRFSEETSGTILFAVYLPANGTAQFTPRGKIKLATADKKLQARTSVAGNIAVTASYHSEA